MNWRIPLILMVVLVLGGCSDEENPTIPPIEYPFYEQKNLARNVVNSFDQNLEDWDPPTARRYTIRWLNNLEKVSRAGLSADSTTIWYKLNNGIEYLFLTETRSNSLSGLGKKGGKSPLPPVERQGSKAKRVAGQALVLSPFKWNQPEEDSALPFECSFIAQSLQSAGMTVDYRFNESRFDSSITLDHFADFAGYQTFAYCGYSPVDANDNVCLGTGIILTSDNYPEFRNAIQSGILRPMILDTGYGHITAEIFLAVTPEWLARESATRIENGVVYLGTGSGLFNPGLAEVMSGSGSGCFGWDHRVTSDLASRAAQNLFAQLVFNGSSFWDSYVAVHSAGNGQEQLPVGSGREISYFDFIGDRNGRLYDREIHIACTPPAYDDFGEVVQMVGVVPLTIELSDLEDTEALSGYDAVFINCAENLEALADLAADSIRSYVENGGVLVVSDFAFAFVQASFPDMIDFPAYPYIGGAGSFIGHFQNPALQDLFSDEEVDLEFALGSWVLVNDVAPEVNELIRASVEIIDKSGNKRGQHTGEARELTGEKAVAPILVHFEWGSGDVFFSSFDFRSQDPTTAQSLMNYFLFSILSQP